MCGQGWWPPRTPFVLYSPYRVCNKRFTRTCIIASFSNNHLPTCTKRPIRHLALLTCRFKANNPCRSSSARLTFPISNNYVPTCWIFNRNLISVWSVRDPFARYTVLEGCFKKRYLWTSTAHHKMTRLITYRDIPCP